MAEPKLHYVRRADAVYTVCGIFISPNVLVTSDPAEAKCVRCLSTGLLDRRWVT